MTGQVTVRSTPMRLWIWAATNLASWSMLGAYARAMTSYGPVRQAGSDTPRMFRSAAVTAAALPTLVWIKMYAAITGTRRTFPGPFNTHHQ